MGKSASLKENAAGLYNVLNMNRALQIVLAELFKGNRMLNKHLLNT